MRKAKHVPWARAARPCSVLRRPRSPAVAIVEQRLASGTLSRAARLLPWPVGLGAALDAVRGRVVRERRQPKAVAAALAAVEDAQSLSFDEGLAYERRHFERCLASDEAAALRHLFFAERRARRACSSEHLVSRVSVIGAGTMGTGIALAFATAGIPTTLMDDQATAIVRAQVRIQAVCEKNGSAGDLTSPIKTTDSLAEAAEADLVIEAVFEDMEIKQSLFQRLDGLLSGPTLLVTNTSYLDIDQLASVTSRPDHVLGMHFFAPANVMRLLEIVRGSATSATSLDRAVALARRIGKLPVVVGNGHGFVGNRMLLPYSREANRMLVEGAEPADIDGALEAFGMAMGPLAVSDLAGLDIGWRRRQAVGLSNGSQFPFWAVADKLVSIGRLGQKTGIGFYRYEVEGRRSVRRDDPGLQPVLHEIRRQLGVSQRRISADEIVDRCITALVNEGLIVLAEGVAKSAADIDLVYVHGYGFPAWRGGPMHYADLVGFSSIGQSVERWRATLGPEWAPSPLLAELAAGRAALTDLSMKSYR